jgi:hypothetical protein
MAGGHDEKSGKIWTILRVVLILAVLALIIYWLVTGGPQAAWRAGQNFTNPIALIFDNGTSTGTFMHLPWQTETTRGPDISGYVGVADQQLEDANGGSSQASQPSPNASEVTARIQQYGTPSPYAGEVTLAGSNATAASPSQEYVQLQASSDNRGAVAIGGWSLQSAASGAHGAIPEAAPYFIGGVVNSVQPVNLAPGATTVVTTGASPVGVSFQENICSGYLSELQHFTPDLGNSCPSPSDALPETAENLRTYGASCFDYLASIPSCHFVGSSIPSGISQSCRQFVGNNLSYNGCVAMYRSQTNFTLPTFRLYLGVRAKLWNDSHDIIRLLDAQGRVVDVLTY